MTRTRYYPVPREARPDPLDFLAPLGADAHGVTWTLTPGAAMPDCKGSDYNPAAAIDGNRWTAARRDALARRYFPVAYARAEVTVNRTAYRLQVPVYCGPCGFVRGEGGRRVAEPGEWHTDAQDIHTTREDGRAVTDNARRKLWNACDALAEALNADPIFSAELLELCHQSAMAHAAERVAEARAALADAETFAQVVEDDRR